MNQSPSGNSRQVWLGIIISLICLVAIFYFIRPQEIIEAIKTARYEYLLISAVAIVVFMFMRAIRWRFMLNNDAPIMTVFHIQNIGYLISTVLPLRLGDVARSVLIGSVPPITISRGISTMVFERVLDMLFIVILLPFTLASVDYLPEWMRGGALVSGIAAIAAFLILIIAANQRANVEKVVTYVLDYLPFLNTKAWVNRTDNFLAGLDTLTRLKDGTILLLLSIVTWVPIIVAYYTTLIAVNINATPLMAAFVVCAAALSVALPSSPGQIGVFHAGVIAALQVWGRPEAASASFAFLYHALNSTVLILLGIIGIFSTGSTFRQVVDSTRDFLNRKENTRAGSNSSSPGRGACWHRRADEPRPEGHPTVAQEGPTPGSCHPVAARASGSGIVSPSASRYLTQSARHSRSAASASERVSPSPTTSGISTRRTTPYGSASSSRHSQTRR